jgi:hypothetical protein
VWSDFVSLLCDWLTLGDGLLVLLCYMELERFEMNFEIFELNGSHIPDVVCVADGGVMG